MLLLEEAAGAVDVADLLAADAGAKEKPTGLAFVVEAAEAPKGDGDGVDDEDGC